jgi:putative flippase GtrA
MWLAPKNKSFIRQFWRFAVVGVANTGFSLSIIVLAKWLLGLGDVPANILGYSVGLLVSFQLNASWTFGHQGNLIPALAKYLIAFGLAYAANLCTVLMLIHWFDVSSYVAQIVGAAPYTACFFLISRYIVFQRSDDAGSLV